MKDNLEETWIYKIMQEFHELKGSSEDFCWEDVEEEEGFEDFLVTKVAEHKVPVHIEYYRGQETTAPNNWRIYIDSDWKEYDSHTIRFDYSKDSSEEWCKKRDLIAYKITSLPESYKLFYQEYKTLCKKHGLMICSEGESVDIDRYEDGLWEVKESTIRYANRQKSNGCPAFREPNPEERNE